MTAGPRKFRDRQNYQHNLSAVRAVVDQRSAAAWEGTVYDGWLATLRELSRPTTDSKFPEAMRSRAWAMKSLTTQLASWTQLRHDTILYTKQSYTSQVMCFYPAGYVEPISAFWTRMEALAARCAGLLEKTPFPDVKVEAVGRLSSNGRERWLPLTHYQKHQVEFLRRFAAQVGVLKSIAAKQLDQKELNADEVKVLKEIVHRPSGGSGYTRYDGWYPSLFYSGKYDCAKWEPLVADVHTDKPSPAIGDPGCILHQGVGNVDLLMITIENGTDRVVYAGPVLSHYEFETPVNIRRTDSEWQKDANAGKLPPRPEWTKSYLVPGFNPDAKDFGKVKDKE
jgi:hypothetical protein